MDLDQYIAQKRLSVRRIPAGIHSRWHSRVLANGWHQQGQAGAEAYLKRYGRNIGAPKCIHLALKAEGEGAYGMAMGFWIKAYTVELGQEPPEESLIPAASSMGPASSAATAPPPAPAAETPTKPKAKRRPASRAQALEL
jgi:hypothetical protein